MAKYQILGEAFIQAAPEYRRYEPGEVVMLPDDELPSENWLPLDEPAEKAMEEQIRLNLIKSESEKFKKDKDKRSIMPMPNPPWDGPVKRREAAHKENKKIRMKRALDEAPGLDPNTMSEIAARKSKSPVGLGLPEALDKMKVDHVERKTKRAADSEPTGG